MHNDHNNNLEYKLFLMACTISMFVCVVLFIVDTFIAKEYISSVLEVVSFIAFLIFYYQAKYKERFQRLLIPFLVTLIVIMNAAWFTGGGLNITNSFVFFLILLLVVIITPKDSKPFFLVVLFVNLILFTSLEFLYPAYSWPVIKNDQMIVVNTIVLE